MEKCIYCKNWNYPNWVLVVFCDNCIHTTTHKVRMHNYLHTYKIANGHITTLQMSSFYISLWTQAIFMLPVNTGSKAISVPRLEPISGLSLWDTICYPTGLKNEWHCHFMKTVLLVGLEDTSLAVKQKLFQNTTPAHNVLCPATAEHDTSYCNYNVLVISPGTTI